MCVPFVESRQFVAIVFHLLFLLDLWILSFWLTDVVPLPISSPQINKRIFVFHYMFGYLISIRKDLSLAFMATTNQTNKKWALKNPYAFFWETCFDFKFCKNASNIYVYVVHTCSAVWADRIKDGRRHYTIAPNHSIDCTRRWITFPNVFGHPVGIGYIHRNVNR